MAKHIQPKLNQPKDHVIREALQNGGWTQAERLLNNLALMGKGDRYYSAQDLIDSAAEAAAHLHDFVALLDLSGFHATVIDYVIKATPHYAPLRDQALALVAEMDLCVASPVSKRRGA